MAWSHPADPCAGKEGWDTGVGGVVGTTTRNAPVRPGTIPSVYSGPENPGGHYGSVRSLSTVEGYTFVVGGVVGVRAGHSTLIVLD